MIRGLLRLPLVCRLAGRRLVTVYVVGRKTGRRFAVPVAYTRHHDALLVGTEFGWGRNLRTGEPVEIRLQGTRRTADVEVITDEAGVIEGYATICRGNHGFARFNKVRIDDSGQPDPHDLHLAWAAGARVFRLSPQ
jgi:deazaflavin-dependent oxidoreductase (nitroreductase family)